MSINHYTEYKQKIKEAQTRGFTDVETIKEAKNLICLAYTREQIPLRLTRMGATVKVFPT